MRSAAQGSTFQEWLAEMLALEDAVSGALADQRSVVSGHPEASAAVERFHALAQGHCDALAAHLAGLGVAAAPAGRPATMPLAALLAPLSAATPSAGGLAVAAALWRDYTAFHHMAMGYGLLYGIAHRAYAERSEAPTHRLAEHHQRHYAEAAQEIVRMVADVLVWELARRGAACRCLCPSCRGLGLCICLNGGRSLTIGAFAETAVPEERGVVVRQLRPAGPAARAGLCLSDVITAVDGEGVADIWGFNGLLGGFRAGRPVRLRVERQGSVHEVAVSP